MNAKPMKAPAVLRGLGWIWTDAGPILQLRIDGRQIAVLVPLARVNVEFSREFAAVGCPLAPSVGAYGVGGWFSSIKKAAKKVGRSATRVVKRAAKGVSRVAKKYGGKALRKAKGVVRNRYFRTGLAAAAIAVPALAPVAAGVETANRALDYYERGKKVAERVARGIERPGDVAKMAAAVATEQAIGEIAKQAQRGSPDAQRWIGGLETAKAARGFARQASRAVAPSMFRGFAPRAPMRRPFGGRIRTRRPMPARFGRMPAPAFRPSQFMRGWGFA